MLYSLIECSQAQDAESMFIILLDEILSKPFGQNVAKLLRLNQKTNRKRRNHYSYIISKNKKAKFNRKES